MWRPKTLLVVAVGLALCGPVYAADVDLSGDWILTMEGDSPSGRDSVLVNFAVDGYRLVATMKGEESDVDCQGWLDENRVRFYYVRDGHDGEFVAKYTGHVAGDLMGGEVDLGGQGKTKWRAVRGGSKGTDLSGTWTMTMEGESPSGQGSVKMTFAQQGPSLVATMTNDMGQVECEGYIEGNALRFYYIRGDFVAKYTGHVGGDLMGGEVDMGGESKTTWRATRE